MAEKQWCERCQDYQWSAYRRPDAGGRVLCNQHYYEFLRRPCQTGLVRTSVELRKEAQKLGGGH